MNLHLTNTETINPIKSKKFSNNHLNMIDTKSFTKSTTLNHIKLLYNDEVNSLNKQEFQ